LTLSKRAENHSSWEGGKRRPPWFRKANVSVGRRTRSREERKEKLHGKNSLRRQKNERRNRARESHKVGGATKINSNLQNSSLVSGSGRASKDCKKTGHKSFKKKKKRGRKKEIREGEKLTPQTWELALGPWGRVTSDHNAKKRCQKRIGKKGRRT